MNITPFFSVHFPTPPLKENFILSDGCIDSTTDLISNLCFLEKCLSTAIYHNLVICSFPKDSRLKLVYIASVHCTAHHVRIF